MASQDMDSLAFGAARLLRHLIDPISKKSAVVEFEIARVLVQILSSVLLWINMYSFLYIF